MHELVILVTTYRRPMLKRMIFMGNTEIAYLKNQITLLREEMKNLLIALLESGLIEITEEDGKKVYKINKVK
jgi:hypothetical protein